MTLYFLDASAWVKRYFREAGSEWVGRLFEANRLLSAATLGLIEVNATNARKWGAGEVEAEQFAANKDCLLADWAGFLWVELSAEVVQEALQLSETMGLRGADSVQLASAVVLQRRLGVDGGEFTFVGSDRELNSAAVRAGLRVVNPEEALC